MKSAIQGFPIFCVFILLQLAAFSQVGNPDSSKYNNQLDLKDVFYNIFKTKQKEKGANKKIQLSAYPAAGYSSSTSFAVLGGANMLFTVKEATKQSVFATSFTYTLFNQTIFPFMGSIWTKNDKFNLILDGRFINYPSSIYGLRGRSKLDSGYSVNFMWVKLHGTALAKISNNLYAGAGLYYDYFWNIEELGILSGDINLPGSRTAFEHYVKKKIPKSHESAFGPAFKLLFDSRNNPLNASAGVFLSASFHPFFKGWGSDTSSGSLVVEARKYFSFSTRHHSVLALWAYYWQTFGKAPFLLLPGTGWDEYWNTGRGYSQGRFRGSLMRYVEAEYRFQISTNGLIGGVIFTNVQNFPDELFTSYSRYHDRQSVNVTVLGVGTGIRLKLNKYSKTNLALDFGFGQDFPRPWIAVNLGEVF